MAVVVTICECVSVYASCFDFPRLTLSHSVGGVILKHSVQNTLQVIYPSTVAYTNYGNGYQSLTANGAVEADVVLAGLGKPAFPGPIVIDSGKGY